MKKLACALRFYFAFALLSAAQQSATDAPASRDDVARYMQVVNSRDRVNKTINAMSKPMHDMIHQQYLQNSDKLPADFEVRTNQKLDQTSKDLPWDDLLQTMVPIYQKHFTKGDIDALVAFYGGPTGQKVLREMPAITAELIQSMMPMLQKNIESMNHALTQEMTAMMKEDGSKNQPAHPQSNQ